jgi:hypothetical protein
MAAAKLQLNQEARAASPTLVQAFSSSGSRPVTVEYASNKTLYYGRAPGYFRR